MSLATEEAKDNVVRVGHRMAQSRLVVGSWGNISTLVKKDKLVIITPSAVNCDNLHAHALITVDLEGNVVEGNLKPSTELKLHLAVYKSRPDVNAIVHTHSTYGCAMAVSRQALPPILEDMAQLVGGPVPVAEYAPAGTAELAENCSHALGKLNAVFLANHGVIGVGRELEEAFQVCQIVERTAKVYILSGILGTPHVLTPEDVKFHHNYYLTCYRRPTNKNK
jgi:L-fuculose-phosphate aldolase